MIERIPLEIDEKGEYVDSNSNQSGKNGENLPMSLRGNGELYREFCYKMEESIELMRILGIKNFRGRIRGLPDGSEIEFSHENFQDGRYLDGRT